MIDAHLAKFAGEQRRSLEILRDDLRELLPGAQECLKYGMPAFVIGGKTVAGFDGFKNHNSYFPHSGGVISQVKALPQWCDGSGGTLRFPIGKRLPKALLRELIRLRTAEIESRARPKNKNGAAPKRRPTS